MKLFLHKAAALTEQPVMKDLNEQEMEQVMGAYNSGWEQGRDEWRRCDEDRRRDEWRRRDEERRRDEDFHHPWHWNWRR